MSIDVTKQTAYVEFVGKDMAITKQTAYVEFVAKDMTITKQTAYVLFYVPPPPAFGRRRMPLIIN